MFILKHFTKASSLKDYFFSSSTSEKKDLSIWLKLNEAEIQYEWETLEKIKNKPVESGVILLSNISEFRLNENESGEEGNENTMMNSVLCSKQG